MNAMTIVELVCSGDHVELCNAADAIGSALAARGVEPGERVASMLPHGPAWIAALIGVASIRAAFVPVADAADEPSTRRALRATGARVLLASASAALGAGLRAAAAELGVTIVRISFDERGIALVDGDHVYDAHARVAEPADVAFVWSAGELTHEALVAAAGNRGLGGLLDAVGAPPEALRIAA